MKKDRKIVLAVTGASGTIYARLLLERLLEQKGIEQIALIFSETGSEVAQYEQELERIELLAEDRRVVRYNNTDLFAPTASGSARYDTMVIIPCTMGTVGRVANGISGDLLSRTADVILKERRRLILSIRETPLNTIHLRNLTTLSECGAIVLPLSPSFYTAPKNIEELCQTVVERVVTLMGFESEGYQWSGRQNG